MGVWMLKLSRIVAAAAVAACVPAGLVMAQNAPATGSDTTAAPAPAPAATTPEPAATTPAPAATTSAPAATTSAPATTAPAATAPATTQNDQPMKKKKTAKMTRQQEIDKSIDSGTVPSRYRKQVPKEYQQYIPFSK
jgi:hypothetical protein